jgi:outer membrane receptor protein involved in Fe transport
MMKRRASAVLLCGFAWGLGIAPFQIRSARAEDAPPPSAPPTAPFTPSGEGGPMQPPAPPPPPPLNLDLDLNIEESYRIFQAKKTVVSASTKREQKLDDVPLTLSVIPAEELAGTGQFTLCDAIQYFPGLECRRGAMRKAAVSVRGLGSNFLSNRMLLLIDGRPATDPWTGQFYADETTPLANLKQLEVIRGPGSALYGSSAFSGVINLLTRDADDLIAKGRRWGVDARVLAGQYATARTMLTAAGRVGPVSGLVDYYFYRSNGAQLLSDPKKGIVDENEGSQVHQVTGKLAVNKGKTSAGIDVGYNWSELGRPGGVAVSAVGNCGRCHYTPKDREQVQQFWFNAHLDQRVTKWFRLYGQVYGNWKRREVTLDNTITQDPEQALGKRRRVGAELRALFSHKYVNVTIGGDVKFDEANSKNILPTLVPGDINQRIYGVFADAEVRPIAKLIIGAGVRYDYYDIPAKLWAASSSQVSPRASIVHHAIPQLTLRANYGRAFRAPSLVELAINQQMYAATLVGNPFLRAETVDTAEAALDAWPYKQYLRLTLTGFYNRANNLINQEQIGGSTSQFQNIGTATAAGVEAEAAAQIPQIEASFDVGYQYLYTQASTTADGVGPLDYAPQHRVYLRAHKRFSVGVFIDFYGLYVSERRDPALVVNADGGHGGRTVLPGYFVANARVGAKIWKGLSASLIATNLFNTSYQEMLGYPQPGISVFGELRYQY